MRYVKSVDASTSIGQILCAIPLGSVPPYANTMAELHAAAQLKPNQILENIREDHTVTAWLMFYCTQTLTLSADVIEVVPNGPPSPPPPPTPTATQTENVPPRPTPAVKEDLFSPPPTTSPICELAVQQLGVTLTTLKKIYPNITASSSPSRTEFLAACAQQPQPVQFCIRAAYLKDNVDACRTVFNDMAPAQRRRLFGAFSAGFE